jgi:uncharacterized protein YjbI with pentapeptide repeats
MQRTDAHTRPTNTGALRFATALAVTVALVVAACGSGSDSTVAREAAGDDNAAVLGATARVVNGCTIAPGTICEQVNFANANLTGVDLSGASLGLDRTNPYPGNWEGTNLTEANLSKAAVWCVEGTANLSKVDFSGAELIDLNLYGSNLRGADFSGAYLVNVNFNGADLTGANLDWASATAVYLPDGTWVGGSQTRDDECGD